MAIPISPRCRCHSHAGGDVYQDRTRTQDRWSFRRPDEYLRSDARERSGPALGRLLNLTDGLMGEGSRTLVLLTTNDLLGRIHPAVQRPGRCRASIEFPAMSAAEAAAWCPPGVKEPASPATLAELYALMRGQDVPDAEPGAGMYL